MKKIRVSFGILFLIIIVVLSAKTIKNMVDYYVEGTIVNNDDLEQDNIESVINSTFAKKNLFVNLNGAMSSLLRQPSMNGIVKLNNGYLVQTQEKCSKEKIEEYANNVAGFNTYLQSTGKKLVYVSPTSRVKDNTFLPPGIDDYSNDNIDLLLQALIEKGIDIIDLRQEEAKDGLSFYDLMYKTDHHWNAEAGFYAYTKIEKYITDTTACIIDEHVADVNNYTVLDRANRFLGSYGKRTGKYYAGLDDIKIYIPDYETTLINQWGETGSVQDFLIHSEELDNGISYELDYTYDNIFVDSRQYYKNENAFNDLKVLVISDSYANVVMPYLTASFYEVNFAYDQSVENIVNKEYIDAYNPDVVVMLYYPETISDNSTCFSFTDFN